MGQRQLSLGGKSTLLSSRTRCAISCSGRSFFTACCPLPGLSLRCPKTSASFSRPSAYGSLARRIFLRISSDCWLRSGRKTCLQADRFGLADRRTAAASRLHRFGKILASRINCRRDRRLTAGLRTKRQRSGPGHPRVVTQSQNRHKYRGTFAW
jgi:hypothetical protein